MNRELDQASGLNYLLAILDPGGQKQAAEIPESYTGLEGKKILIAEDNKINFFVANKFLVSWGITVKHAADGLLRS